MKVQIQRNLLLNALDKMFDVSTRALLPNFNFSGRVTVDVKSDEVCFISANGCLTAQCAITEETDPGISGCETGIVAVDSVKLRDSVRRIITETDSSPIELSDNGSMFTIKDVTSKRKKLVKLPREDTNSKYHPRAIPGPDGSTSFLDVEKFVKAVNTVAPFQSKAMYRDEYQLICAHWLIDEVRFVCGDGAIFAVFSFARSSKDKSKKQLRRVVPVDQFLIVSSLLQDKLGDLEIIWKDKEQLWIQCDDVTMMLKGIPDMPYLDYDQNAFRFDEAKAYADIKTHDLREAANLLAVLRDKEKVDQGKCPSCYVTAPSIPDHMKFEIRKDQGKFQCEYEIPFEYYDLDNQPSFSARYAHVFFEKPVHANRHPYLRLYLIDESDVANARDVDLGDKNSDGIPKILEEPDGCQLSYFFAALKDDLEIKEDA